MKSPFFIIIVASILFRSTATTAPEASPFYLYFIPVHHKGEPVVLPLDLHLPLAMGSFFPSTYNIPSKGILTSSNCSILLDCASVTAEQLSTDMTDLVVREALKPSLEVHIVARGAVTLPLCGAGPSLCGADWLQQRLE